MTQMPYIKYEDMSDEYAWTLLKVLLSHYLYRLVNEPWNQK